MALEESFLTDSVCALSHEEPMLLKAFLQQKELIQDHGQYPSLLVQKVHTLHPPPPFFVHLIENQFKLKRVASALPSIVLNVYTCGIFQSVIFGNNIFYSTENIFGFEAWG